MSEPSYDDVRLTEVDEQSHPEVQPHHAPRGPMRIRIQRLASGPVAVEEAQGTDAVHWHARADHGFLVGIPVRGGVHVDHEGTDLDVAPGAAVVVDPEADATVDTGDGFDMMVIDVDSAALASMLEALLDRAVPRPLRLHTSVPLRSRQGRAWAGTVAHVVEDAGEATSSLATPISAEPLHDNLLARLLLVAQHAHREELDSEVVDWAPKAVERCVDYVEAHPREPHTMARLAREAGMSIRALDAAWRRYRGVSPAEDIARIRLRHAHAELAQHRPGETTVALVATGWGFRPAPFTRAYRTRYGLSPYQTLRGPAYA